jgi:hypothetical protein
MFNHSSLIQNDMVSGVVGIQLSMSDEVDPSIAQSPNSWVLAREHVERRKPLINRPYKVFTLRPSINLAAGSRLEALNRGVF